MREITDGLHTLALPGVNVHLLGTTTVVDAGIRGCGPLLARDLRSSADGLERHVLTHAHPDHQGASAFLCRRYGLRFGAGALDAEAARTGRVTRDVLPGPLSRGFDVLGAGPGHPVDDELREGDEVGGGFVVLDTPGHTRGHVSFFRERDRALVIGDVVFHVRVPGTSRFVNPPGAVGSSDADNRASAKRLAALRPKVAVFGHGPALRDPGLLAEHAARL